MRSNLINFLIILVGIVLTVMLIFTPINGFFFMINELGGFPYVANKHMSYNELTTLSLYNVKNIDVDKAGNIFISSGKHLCIYGRLGVSRGQLYLPTSDYAFKVDGTVLTVISSDKRIIDSENKAGTYEIAYELTFIHDWEYNGGNELTVLYTKEHNQNFKDYSKENGFENKTEVTKDGTTYKYASYGKVDISNETLYETIVLADVGTLPLPMLPILFIDAILITLFASLFVLPSFKKKT